MQYLLQQLKLRYLIILVFGIIIYSCNKDKPAKGIDAELFEMASETEGFVWYRFSEELLSKSSGSGHTAPYLRTRYNSIAAIYLDSIGKVKTDTEFPDGALIVKELRKDENTLERYAILYKQTDHEFADSHGWIWGYINNDKTVRVSATEKGSSCIQCHLQDANIDYTLMNKFFP